MPELPEVETVKKVLLPIVHNRTIKNIDILRASVVKQDPQEFVSLLKNETFIDITRIGKFLIFHLTHSKVMISHLRMEGKYFEVDEKEDNTKYARVVFHLDNGHKLCYDDSRTFGLLKVSDEDNYKKEKELAEIGIEPMSVKDVSFLLERNKKNKGPIKSTLLDQTLLTGLGNIYVDETLFKSHIHPLTPANKITKSEWEIIVKNASETLNSAIEQGGSTIRSYHPGKDIDGNFQVSLLCYGKYGEECPICHTPFRFIKVGGRGTTYCPHCQIKKGGPINVALTGKIASGKSTVLEAFKSLGCSSISSDEIVSELYKNNEIVNHINKMFSLDFNSEVNKDVLREYLISHPMDVRKLERYIHPLVLSKILCFMKEDKSDIRVIEVPLLFQAKMENNFDVVIMLDINEEKQNIRLEKRNGKASSSLKTINSNKEFNEYKNKADFIIENNAGLIDLNKRVKEIFNKLEDRLN